MITCRSLSVIVLGLSALHATAALAQYVPAARETTVLESLGRQERKVFEADGISVLGAYLNVKHTNARQAARMYAQNEVAADKELYRKNVLLSGTIASINSGFGNTPYLVLESASVLQVQAHLVSGTVDRAATLKKGQTLKLLCQGAGALAGSPVFRNCQFADEAAKQKWNEVIERLEAYYKGEKATPVAVQHMAIAASAITAGLPADACRSADDNCYAAMKKVMYGDKFISLMSQATERFKAAGLAVPTT